MNKAEQILEKLAREWATNPTPDNESYLDQAWEQYKLERKEINKRLVLDAAWEAEKAERERVERLKWENKGA